MSASVAGTSTIGTFLYYFPSATAKPTDFSSGEKLVDIKSYPDLGGAPETVETTTLSDRVQTSVNGVQSVDAFDFTANYDKASYRKLKSIELAGKTGWYAVVFGEDESEKADGHDGVVVWSGQLAAYISSGEVNGVKEMHAVISVSTVPELLADGASA